jgi:hypothetical protein
METSVKDLRQILRLKKVDWVQPDEPDTTTFYIRSFQMTAHDFGEILRKMMTNGYHMNEKMFIWQEMIHKIGDDADNVVWTLRYGGKTVGSPLSRHVEDLRTARQRAHTWFSHFLKIVQEDFPYIIDDVVVEEVVKATVTRVKSPEILDLREQALIALLGVGSLNMQAGGSDVVSWITQEDEAVFSMLGTNNQASLHRLQRCPDSMRSEIEKYAEDSRQYAQDHPKSAGVTATRKFSEELRDCIAQQAMPAVGYLGCALITSIASDIGQDDHDDTTFFNSNRRSSNIVKLCYDSLIHWEKPYGRPFTHGEVVTMANAGYLPFVDVFPWFAKHKDDYEAAAGLLMNYLRATKPLILLTYGQTPSYLALSSFEDTTANAYWKTQRDGNNEQGCNYFINQLGRPILCNIGQDGDEVVIIPSYHPGYTAQAGPLAPQATRLLFFVHQISWYAMNVGLQCDAESLSRAKTCRKIVSEVKQILNPQHKFGRAFAKAVNEACIVNKAFNEDRALRMLAAKRDKSNEADSPSAPHIMVPTASGQSFAYQLTFGEQRLDEDKAPKGRKGKHIQYVMTWSEPSVEDPDVVEVWVIGPLELSEGLAIIGSQPSKRYIMYTKEGLDILDDNGKSLDKRDPMLSGKGKNCTLPISMIVLYSDIEDEGDRKFLSHWEKRTEQSIDLYLLSCLSGAILHPDGRDPYIHSSFFEVSPTKRPLPIPYLKIFQKDKKKWYADFINNTLVPVNPGDMLWLFAQLLLDICGTSKGKVTFNVADPFESAESIYGHIARFCSKKKYRAHPHWRSLLALAHLSGVDMSDRLYANNVVHIAVEALIANTSTVKKILVKIQGKRYDRTPMTYTIANVFAFYNNKIAPYQEPDLIQDIEDVDPSAEGSEMASASSSKQPGKRGREKSSDDDDDDENGHESDSSDYVTSTTKKGKGKLVPKASTAVGEKAKPVLKRQKAWRTPPRDLSDEAATSRGRSPAETSRGGSSSNGGVAGGGASRRPSPPWHLGESFHLMTFGGRYHAARNRGASGGDPSRGGLSNAGPSGGSTSHAGTGSGATTSGGASYGGQSRGQSRGGPSRGGPSRGGPSRGGPSRGGPSRGGQSRGGPSGWGSNAGPSTASSSRTMGEKPAEGYEDDYE